MPIFFVCKDVVLYFIICRAESDCIARIASRIVKAGLENARIEPLRVSTAPESNSFCLAVVGVKRDAVVIVTVTTGKASQGVKQLLCPFANACMSADVGKISKANGCREA